MMMSDTAEPKQILVNGRPIDFDKAPPNCADSLQRYIERRILPGSFLTAFLSNDLMNAIGCADHINRHQFYEIACWLYNHAPSQCYGSQEKVWAWVGQRVVTAGA